MPKAKTLDTNTEQLIIEAARKIFSQKGFAGTRMEDIATEAGINRALLNYYFRSKEKIFELVFEERFKLFFMGMAQIVLSDTPLLEKIKQIIEYEITILSKNLDLPLFVISEIAQNPHLILERMEKNAPMPKTMVLEKFRQQTAEAVANGFIRPIDGRDLFVNVVSLAVFQFVARPILQGFLGFDQEQYLQFLERRKTELVDFILAGIRK